MKNKIVVRGAMAVALLAVATLAVAWLRPSLFGFGKERIDATTIGASFSDIAELATEEYVFSDVGRFDQEGLHVAGLKVPFTGRNFLVTYSGRVTAGLRNAEGIEAEVDDASKTLTIALPAVEVLDSHIDANSVEVYDQTMNPINQLRVSDVTSFISNREDAAREKAVEEGLLDRARDHAEQLMLSHAKALTAGTNMDGYALSVDWK